MCWQEEVVGPDSCKRTGSWYQRSRLEEDRHDLYAPWSYRSDSHRAADSAEGFASWVDYSILDASSSRQDFLSSLLLSACRGIQQHKEHSKVPAEAAVLGLDFWGSFRLGILRPSMWLAFPKCALNAFSRSFCSCHVEKSFFWKRERMLAVSSSHESTLYCHISWSCRDCSLWLWSQRSHSDHQHVSFSGKGPPEKYCIWDTPASDESSWSHSIRFIPTAAAL